MRYFVIAIPEEAEDMLRHITEVVYEFSADKYRVWEIEEGVIEDHTGLMDYIEPSV